MIVLGIETSCDETSAAVLQDGKLRSNVISSQIVHKPFGGIVPELASRAHQSLIVPVVREALESASISKIDLNAVAVTRGPGLMGALLVGLNFAKAFAFGLKIPLVGVNHLEGHIYSNLLSEYAPAFPFLCLLVSGGHTQIILVEKPLKHIVLGETLDDAAGEAYDKVGKMLGLGFPGGPEIDRLAAEGNPLFVEFPRSMLSTDNYDFSFSGIKTSVMYWLRDHGYYGSARAKPIEASTLRNICASFQAAILDVLITKIFNAATRLGIRDIAIAGGVSANRELRNRTADLAEVKGIRVFIPRLEFCTDNAAMIAMAGYLRLAAGQYSPTEITATANLPL